MTWPIYVRLNCGWSLVEGSKESQYLRASAVEIHMARINETILACVILPKNYFAFCIVLFSILRFYSVKRVRIICITHWVRVTHIWWWLVVWSAPSHCLIQCWNIVKWIPRKKFQWLFNRNSYSFFHENAFDYFVCKMASILFRPPCDDLVM